MTKQDISKYIGSIAGTKATDEDGAYGVQCVDLIKRYLKEMFNIPICTLGDGMYVAENVAKKFPTKFEYVPYSKNISPQIGDIISYHSASSPSCGHVAIVFSDFNRTVYSIIEQWNGSGIVKMNTKYILSPVRGENYTIIGIARPFLEIIQLAKTNNDIAKEVINGLWGNGSERKTKLTNAGYDYDTIQKIVNSLLFGETKPTSTTKSNETIAKEVIAGLWDNGTVRRNKLSAAGYNFNTVQKIVNEMLLKKS